MYVFLRFLCFSNCPKETEVCSLIFTPLYLDLEQTVTKEFLGFLFRKVEILFTRNLGNNHSYGYVP